MGKVTTLTEPSRVRCLDMETCCNCMFESYKGKSREDSTRIRTSIRSCGINSRVSCLWVYGVAPSSYRSFKTESLSPRVRGENLEIDSTGSEILTLLAHRSCGLDMTENKDDETAAWDARELSEDLKNRRLKLRGELGLQICLRVVNSTLGYLEWMESSAGLNCPTWKNQNRNDILRERISASMGLRLDSIIKLLSRLIFMLETPYGKPDSSNGYRRIKGMIPKDNQTTQ